MSNILEKYSEKDLIDVIENDKIDLGPRRGKL